MQTTLKMWKRLLKLEMKDNLVQKKQYNVTGADNDMKGKLSFLFILEFEAEDSVLILNKKLLINT